MWKWAKGQAEVLGGSVGSSCCLLVRVGQTSLPPNSHTCSPFRTSQLHLLKERSIPPLLTSSCDNSTSSDQSVCFQAHTFVVLWQIQFVFFSPFYTSSSLFTSNATSSLEFLIVISIPSLSPATATNSNSEVFNLEAPFVCGSSHH